MNYNNCVKYCLSKTGAKEEFIFNDKMQVFTVGGKQFCRVYNINGEKAFLLKSEPELNILLRQKYEGVFAPDKMDSRIWNLVLLDRDVPYDEILFLIDQSYDIHFYALTKKKQKEILDNTQAD